MKRFLVMFVAVFLIGCPPPPPPPPPGPPPADADPTACADACAVIVRSCPKTKLAEDKDCPSACRQVESSGYITMHAPCIAKATNVAEIRACNFDCKE